MEQNKKDVIMKIAILQKIRDNLPDNVDLEYDLRLGNTILQLKRGLYEPQKSIDDSSINNCATCSFRKRTRKGRVWKR